MANSRANTLEQIGTHPHYVVSPALRDLAVGGLLAGLAVLVYGSVTREYFLSDDFVILSWTRVASPDAVLGLFDPRSPWFYRPLLKVVYWALQGLFGLNPVPFHLFTLGMHTLAAWLLYRYAGTVAHAHPATALAASLLFFISPRHVEPIASISAMGELIAVPALFGALLAAHHFAARPRPRTLILSAALLAVGLGGRESPVMLPALALLSLLLFARPRPGRRTLAALGGAYAAVLLGYAVLQLQVVARGAEGGAALTRGGLHYKALNAESVVLGIMDYVNGLVPGLHTLTTLPLDQLRPVAWTELGLLGALGVALALLRWWLPLMGLGWMVLSPLPFIFFNAPTDRYFYMPTIGYSLLVAGSVAAAATWLAARFRRPPIRLLAPALVAVCALLLLPQWPAIQANAAHWNAAGGVSRAVLTGMRRAVPTPVREQAFVFVDLPTEYEGVPLFRNGLQEAVQLIYGDDRSLQAGVVACADLRAGLPAPPDSALQFTGGAVRLLTAPPDCP
jgi:hypothetical protein